MCEVNTAALQAAPTDVKHTLRMIEYPSGANTSDLNAVLCNKTRMAGYSIDKDFKFCTFPFKVRQKVCVINICHRAAFASVAVCG